MDIFKFTFNHIVFQMLKSETSDDAEEKKPSTEWPTSGEVEIKDFSMRYREGLPLVLKGINCHIKPKEKIGIAGRTGSGRLET